MTTKRLSLVAALVLASCTTKNQSSYIVIASVLGGTPSTPATVPPTCTPGTVETDFLLVNAAETQGHASVRVLNTLAQNGNPGTNRLPRGRSCCLRARPSSATSRRATEQLIAVGRVDKTSSRHHFACVNPTRAR